MKRVCKTKGFKTVYLGWFQWLTSWRIQGKFFGMWNIGDKSWTWNF